MKLSDWRDALINDKKDPRMMIPRSYPRVGWTLNFGQRSTWIFIIVLILVLLCCILFR